MNEDMDLALQAKRSLLKYFGILLAGCLALQIAIALRGNEIDLTAGLLTGVVALYYAYYQYSSHGLLSRLRFGRLVSHSVGFLLVNVSFHAHAFILFITNSAAIRGTSDVAIDDGWFGVLFGMTTFWGLGAILHSAASIANRGFEEI